MRSRGGHQERLPVRINGSENDLIFQYQVAHDQVGLDFDGRFAAWHARKHEHAVSAEVFEHIEAQPRSTCASMCSNTSCLPVRALFVVCDGSSLETLAVVITTSRG